jgi:hypothetical protein
MATGTILTIDSVPPLNLIEYAPVTGSAKVVTPDGTYVLRFEHVPLHLMVCFTTTDGDAFRVVYDPFTDQNWHVAKDGEVRLASVDYEEAANRVRDALRATDEAASTAAQEAWNKAWDTYQLTNESPS